MTDGPIDNYLTSEEEAYFKSGGQNEEKIESSYEGEQDVDSTNATQDEEVSPEVEDTSPEVEDTYDDDAEETTSESKRDYEKAFKAERHKRKELKEAMEAQAKKTAEMEAVVAQLKQSMLGQQQHTQQQAKAPRVEEVIPDPEEDPVGYHQYKINKLEEVVNQQHKYLSAQQQQAQQSAQQNAFMDTYKRSAEQFAAQNKDFYDAYNYIVDARIKEHMAAGYTKPEADSLIVEEELAIAARAYQDKVNPAERMYNLAKNRGFTGKAQAKVSQSKNISDLKKGIANSKSLKSGGGALTDSNQGMSDIDSMDFAEFDKFWAGYKSKSKGIG